MGANGYRLPLAVGVAIAAAGAATLALKPRSGLIEPAPVEPEGYFSRDEIDRARRYQRPRRALGLASMALEGGALAMIAARPPELLQRADSRPIAGAAAVGAGLSAGLTVLALPLSAIGHRRAVSAGISVQSWGAWLGDAGKATAINTAMTGAASAGAIAVIRRFPDDWWAPAAAGAVGLSVLMVALQPVLLDPVFNKFTPLEEGELRSEVLELAGRAGVDVGEVYRVDASKRTTAANAYVNGLGRTKRVVLYDTLLRDFPPAEVSSVVAHELSHVKHRDVPRFLGWMAIAAPAGAHLVQRLAERIAGPARGRPGMLPALALSAGVVSFFAGIAGSALSRRVEVRADVFSLDLAGDADAFISLERRLALKALADPKPPALLQKLFGTHPPTVERIGVGLAWARSR
jgi:STE24 endopeptidase